MLEATLGSLPEERCISDSGLMRAGRTKIRVIPKAIVIRPRMTSLIFFTSLVPKYWPYKDEPMTVVEATKPVTIVVHVLA